MKVEYTILENELKMLVAEIVEINPDKITAEAKFVEDLGTDSMKALEIMAAVEKKYKIRIPEDNLQRIVSLKELTRLVFDIINKGPNGK